MTYHEYVQLNGRMHDGVVYLETGPYCPCCRREQHCTVAIHHVSNNEWVYVWMDGFLGCPNNNRVTSVAEIIKLAREQA